MPGLRQVVQIGRVPVDRQDIQILDLPHIISVSIFFCDQNLICKPEFKNLYLHLDAERS